MKFAYLLVPAMLVATPALAQNQVTPPANSPAPQTGGEQAQQGGAAAQTTPVENEICRRIMTSGSRVSGSRRVCMTERQWRLYDRQQEY